MPDREVQRHRVITAFITPQDSVWQGRIVNVCEDGSWWTWTGKKWEQEAPSLSTPSADDPAIGYCLVASDGEVYAPSIPLEDTPAKILQQLAEVKRTPWLNKEHEGWRACALIPLLRVTDG